MASSPMTEKDNNTKRTRDEEDEDEDAAARVAPPLRRQNAFDYGVFESENTDWDWNFIIGVINELRVVDAEDAATGAVNGAESTA
jgi:hypothetical protein